MYVATWHELGCPKCDAQNFVCAGDMNEQSGYDPELCECWNCGFVFDFEGNVHYYLDAVDGADTGYKKEDL